MLSVAIHKDIAEYQPKVIGKLTGRTLISITVAFSSALDPWRNPFRKRWIISHG